MNNMLLGLIEHGRVKTTARRGQVLRRMAERMVTRATRLGDLLLKDPSKLEADESARIIHAKRLARRVLNNRDALNKLFEDWGPRFLGRPGGYTRTYKLGYRRGDGAPLVLVEFLPAELPEREGGDPTTDAPEQKKGLFSRFRRG